MSAPTDREALAKALHDRFGYPSEHEWEEQPEDVREDWRKDADAIAQAMTAPLCDGCNVREPWEHRCHGEPCPCDECGAVQA